MLIITIADNHFATSEPDGLPSKDFVRAERCYGNELIKRFVDRKRRGSEVNLLNGLNESKAEEASNWSVILLVW